MMEGDGRENRHVTVTGTKDLNFRICYPFLALLSNQFLLVIFLGVGDIRRQIRERFSY